MKKAVLAVVLFFLSAAPLVRADELSKGNKLLLQHGFQVQGLCTKDDVFHLATYKAANYTAICWAGASDVTKHGSPPDFPWARWAMDEKQTPPIGAEKNVMSHLVTLSLGDEPDLNSDKIRQKNIDWLNSIRSRYPRTILCVNNWGMQIQDAPYQDFIKRGKPDMISFDTYPWRCDYKTKQPLAYQGDCGNPLDFYRALKFTRAYAYGNHIPFQIYRQAFHAVEDYSSTIYRDPSPSEFRLNTFAAVAFGAKSIVDFTYNTGATSFFKKPGGDTNKLPLYNDLVEVNRQVRNLGKAMVRLRPIDDSPLTDGKPTNDSRVTSILFLCGQHMENGKPAGNALPTDFHVDNQAAHDKVHPDRGAYSDWETQRNDPYLSGFKVTNTGATGTPTKNDGLRGDVILAWFKVLDESFDGPDYKDEVYLMVLNGLTALDGTPADCRQEVQLDFGTADSPYPYKTIQRLNADSGKVDSLPMTAIGKKMRLILKLDGGCCELLKFPTGAPFVGVESPTKAVGR